VFGEVFVPRPPARGSELPKASREALRTMRSAVVRLCEGADLVIFDTMFTAEDYRLMPHFGHSRPGDAIEICRDAGVKTLALFHHAPERSDTEVDVMLADARDIVARSGTKLSVVAAFEGMDLELGRSDGEGVR
jgi:ribonuclease BN (tRNA processing enzyme)